MRTSFIVCCRVSKNCIIEPRSYRLKDKTKNEGEVMVKETFVKSVLQNNNLISMLVDRGGSCVILPHCFSSGSDCSSNVSRKIMMKPGSLVFSSGSNVQATGDNLSLSDKRQMMRHLGASSLVYLPATLLSLSLSLIQYSLSLSISAVTCSRA